MKEAERRRPTLPQQALRDLLEANGITQDALADAMGVTRYSVNQLANGRRSVTAPMALRLAKALSTTPDFWLNLQKAVDLYDARIELGDALDEVQTVLQPASDEQLFEELPDPARRPT